jgi:hypothetical protein
MATKKQRRRREKGQRHEYVWIDDEGNEVEPDGAEKTSEKADRSASRFERDPQAPSWQRTFRRGAIFAPIMFGTVFLLSPDLPLVTKVTQTLLIVAIFLPFSYFIDRFFYHSFQRRRARGEQASKRGS